MSVRQPPGRKAKLLKRLLGENGSDRSQKDYLLDGDNLEDLTEGQLADWVAFSDENDSDDPPDDD